MIVYEIAYRYAKALFNLVASREQMAKRGEMLALIALLLKKIPKFEKFLLNPQMNKESKKALLQKGISDPALLAFLLLVLEKGKIKYLGEIASKYQQMVTVYRGIIPATLISATAVDDELKAKLKERLEKAYGKAIALQEKIDPQIIGGATLIIENKIVDFGIKGRLEDLKKSLLRQ
jgi:F-type H+-transporting ATPase subunit delta